MLWRLESRDRDLQERWEDRDARTRPTTTGSVSLGECGSWVGGVMCGWAGPGWGWAELGRLTLAPSGDLALTSNPNSPELSDSRQNVSSTMDDSILHE